MGGEPFGVHRFFLWGWNGGWIDLAKGRGQRTTTSIELLWTPFAQIQL